jgi:hypothetical protein
MDAITDAFSDETAEEDTPDELAYYGIVSDMPMNSGVGSTEEIKRTGLVKKILDRIARNSSFTDLIVKVYRRDMSGELPAYRLLAWSVRPFLTLPKGNRYRTTAELTESAVQCIRGLKSVVDFESALPLFTGDTIEIASRLNAFVEFRARVRHSFRAIARKRELSLIVRANPLLVVLDRLVVRSARFAR